MITPKIETIRGSGVPLRGDDIDTDRIIPARYLRCVTFDGLGEHAFEDDRDQDSHHPFNQKQFENASVLVVGKNFGCGSSREHAPQSLNRWGIKGIIGESFAEIFFANCQAMGIPCLTLPNPEISALMETIEENPSLEISIDIQSAKIHFEDKNLAAEIPPGPQQSFLNGTWDATSVLLQAEDQIDIVAARLPYLNGFY